MELTLPIRCQPGRLENPAIDWPDVRRVMRPRENLRPLVMLNLTQGLDCVVSQAMRLVLAAALAVW